MKNTKNIETPKKARHRKVAEMVVAGKTYEEIAKVVSPDVKYPRQTVYNTVQQPGVQKEIVQLIDESNVLSYVTVERIIHNIQSLAFDQTLKPKEREGYLRMLAEYKALLKQVNLNENITSSDALVEEAEKALQSLVRSSNSNDYDKLSEPGLNGEGETGPTPSVNKVEATVDVQCERKSDTNSEGARE